MNLIGAFYNRYRDIFLYFDALEIGLTATPVDYIARNTFTLFSCENQDPTSNFTFNEAINHIPPYLVPSKSNESQRPSSVTVFATPK